MILSTIRKYSLLLLALCTIGHACFVPYAPEMRGWRCEDNKDCPDSTFCFERRCRTSCNDALDCQKAHSEICRSGFCVPPCKVGHTRVCYTGKAETKDVGACRSGQQTCTKDERWGPCERQLLPKKETCNKIDDDCNGKIDDGITCTCIIGSKQECYTENIGCAPTSNGQYKCVGECRKGTQTCGKNAVWGPCTGTVGPKEEVCNGKDDDCDGSVDEKPKLVGKACKSPGQFGPCAKGTYICKNGQLLCPRGAIPAINEKCDNIDNDCDGKVDNNPGQGEYSLTRPCYSGTKGCKEVQGRYQCTLPCQGGAQRCLRNQGVWENTCQGEITPQSETCNGVDDDCDGQTDNGATCPSSQKCEKGKCV